MSLEVALRLVDMTIIFKPMNFHEMQAWHSFQYCMWKKYGHPAKAQFEVEVSPIEYVCVNIHKSYWKTIQNVDVGIACSFPMCKSIFWKKMIFVDDRLRVKFSIDSIFDSI